MDNKKDGNPGTGNHFTQINQTINIQNVGNYYNADVIHNEYYNGELKTTKQGNPVSETEAIREEIIAYVNKTLSLVDDKWKPIYLDLWKDILSLKEVSAEIYDRGRQQNTTFNRKLVANIICYLGNFRGNGTGMYGVYSATPIVMKLEKTTACSTRQELGTTPSKEICDAIDILLKKQDIA